MTRNEMLIKVATLSDQDVVAATIWGEARGQENAGMIAVARVIHNRMIGKEFARTYRAVCLARNQFSCWRGDDPNLPKMLAELKKRDAGRDMDYARGLAASLVFNFQPGFLDITGGATFYKVHNHPSSWFSRKIKEGKLVHSVRIGAHDFYKLG